MNNFAEQLRKILDDQRKELAEIERKEIELAERMTELKADKVDVMLGIRETKKAIEHAESNG